jgi:hypothetical protein
MTELPRRDMRHPTTKWRLAQVEKEETFATLMDEIYYSNPTNEALVGSVNILGDLQRFDEWDFHFNYTAQ